MQMNATTTQTYLADHRARLIAEAQRSHRRGRRLTVLGLLRRTRQVSRPFDVQPAIAPATNC